MFGGHCLFAPKEMPDTLRARIASDVREITTNADVARRLRAMGYISRTESGHELAVLLERERKRWTAVAQKYGAKPSP